jgi:hypothetical protein
MLFVEYNFEIWNKKFQARTGWSKMELAGSKPVMAGSNDT